jgi:HJR/Mrr/RecB family endonuclease
MQNEVKKAYAKMLNSKKYQFVDLSEVDLMDGHEFEDFLCKLYEKLGYKVTNHKKSRDQGVDLTLEKEGEKTIIQAKKYNLTTSVGIDAIKDVVANKETRHANKMMVITTSSKFSQDAHDMALKNNVILIDRVELKKLMKEANMLKNGKD